MFDFKNIILNRFSNKPVKLYRLTGFLILALEFQFRVFEKKPVNQFLNRSNRSNSPKFCDSCR